MTDALDNAACGLMQTDEQGLFRRANRMFCTWVGYSAEELVGKRRFQELLTGGGRIFHQTHWMPLLAMQQSISEVKLELVHRDGAKVPMVMNAIRRDEGGTIVHELAAFIARDRDRYEQELVSTKRRLETLVADSRDRAEFAEQLIGIVSHDLRTPLNTIGMATELLAMDDPSSRAKLLATINRSLDRATHLIADLLDFTAARVGSGLSMSMSHVDLHVTVDEVLESLRVTYPDRILVHAKQGAGQVLLDPNRIQQQLGNLVANAVTYGDPLAPIEVASQIDDEVCRVSVSNAGPPIAADKLATLFQPMTRGSTKGSKSRSVGLGLFIVQQIAKAHGGAARVASAPDRTTFVVEMPRRMM